MKYSQKLEKIFSGKFVEISKNHDEILLEINDFYKKTTNLPIPILVNYDAHSDIFLNCKLMSSTIGNWVNYCVTNYGIKEYYWIIPDYIKIGNMPKTQSNITGPLIYNDLHQNRIKTYITNQSYEIVTNQRINNFYKKCCTEFGINGIYNKYDELDIYIIRLKDISVLKNRNIILSIDADAFCNSGFDTFENINNKDISVVNLRKQFQIFVNALYENKINPLCVSLTRSPAYFPQKFEFELYQFYEDIKKASICYKDNSVI